MQKYKLSIVPPADNLVPLCTKQEKCPIFPPIAQLAAIDTVPVCPEAFIKYTYPSQGVIYTDSAFISILSVTLSEFNLFSMSVKLLFNNNIY